MHKILMIAAGVLLASTAYAQEETTMALEDVPQAAMDAAMAEAEGVTFDAVAMDSDEGTETYELSGPMANGMTMEVDVLADGTIEEVEEQIDFADVPEAVSAALEAEMAGFTPDYSERSTREDGATIVYEFEGTWEGQEVDVEINEDGTGFMSNMDAAG